MQTRVLTNDEVAPDVHVLTLTRPESLAYEPGQFVILQTVVDEKPLRRSYSVASAPHMDVLELAVRRQRPGQFSPVLCEAAPQDTLSLLGPYGHFLLPSDDDPLVLYAAGTGITPFMSYLRAMREENDPRPVTLLYSARTPQALLYREELESLSETLNLTLHLTITRPDDAEQGWDGLTGRIDDELLATTRPPVDAWHYLCGPTPMIRSVKELLLERGADKKRLKQEYFGNISA